MGYGNHESEKQPKQVELSWFTYKVWEPLLYIAKIMAECPLVWVLSSPHKLRFLLALESTNLLCVFPWRASLFISLYQSITELKDKEDSQSVSQFGCSVVSDSLRPHELQHARPPCPSPTPRVLSNSCPLSQWCHPTISFSVIPFSSCLQSFPALGFFQKSQLFTSGGQSIGVSALASGLPIHIQDWFPLGWTGWTSLQSKLLSRVFSNTTVQKHLFFGTQISL